MENDDGSTASLQFVYEDLAARLSNDTANSWQVIALSGLLLTILGALASQFSRSLEKIVAGISGVFLFLAIGAGFLSIISFRAAARIPYKGLLLGKHGEHAYSQLKLLIAENRSVSIFHTSDFLARGVSTEARTKYLEDVRTRYQSDLVDYLFFLADLIEVRKRPRGFMLLCAAIGTASLIAVPVLRAASTISKLLF